MKKTILLMSVMALFTFSANATKWRVNNMPGVNANFSDLSTALSSSSVMSGDTLYVEPSATTYSGGTLTKALTIIGNGYFTTNTQFITNNAGLQANMDNSKITSLTFNPGSAGSTVMGVYISNSLIIATSNITIKRNIFWSNQLLISNYQTPGYASLSNIDIRQNVFVGASNSSGIAPYSFSATGGYTISNINVQNNIFIGYYCGLSLPVGMSGVVQNNVFDGTSGVGLNAYNFQIDNNIAINSAFTANNCVYFNNIANNTIFGTTNSNQQNISTTALFSNYSTSLTETRYTLATAGPGAGTGFGGIDVGVFGGPDPYKLSGIPPVPTIYSLTAPATTSTSTLSVTISTRSND